MVNLKAASYLCEDMQADEYNAEREVIECYNDETGAVDFVDPNPDHFNTMLKIVKREGIKKITITGSSEIKAYPLYLVYMEYNGKITNITNKPGSSYYTFEIELP